MKLEFIEVVKQPGITMAEGCRRYKISRKTGYKWLKRYNEEGESGLRDKSRTSLNTNRKLTEEVIFRIVAIRAAHKHWRADKIRSILKREHVVPLPGRTIIHSGLKQTGLISLLKKTS